MSLPSPIIAVLAHFQPLFTAPTWRKGVMLLVGTILARGRQTVTAALRLSAKHVGKDLTQAWRPAALALRTMMLSSAHKG